MKSLKALRNIAILILSAVSLCGCGADKNNIGAAKEQLSSFGKITVVNREDGSGTKDALSDLIGISEAAAPEDAVVLSSTADVIDFVANNPSAIGYGSYGALDNEDVKVISVDGVEISEKNIKSRKYKLSRPFNIAYIGMLNTLETDFINYIKTAGQSVVSENYIPISKAAVFVTDRSSGAITIDGSSSAAPLMEELIKGYKEYNPNAQITYNTSDSTSGLTSAMMGRSSLGVASRDLKDYENEILSCETIATDGIAVFVNRNNPISNLSAKMLQGIYTGTYSTWDSLAE